MDLPLTLKYALRHAVRRQPIAAYLCADLMSREYAPPQEHRARQELFLQRTFRAAATLPGYAGKVANAPGARLVRYLRQFPIIDKSDLVRRRRDFYPNGGIPKHWWQVAASSGTTGTPIDMFRTLGSVVWEEAFHLQHWRWAGWRRGERQIVLRGDLVTPPGQSHPPFWFRDVLGGQLIVSTCHQCFGIPPFG